MPHSTQKKSSVIAKVESLNKLKLSAEFRNISSTIEKCIAMKKFSGTSWRSLSLSFDIPLTTLLRAVRAKEEKREAHIRGRPSFLNEEEKKSLVELIKKAQQERTALTRSDLLNHVFYTIFLSYFNNF